MNGDIESTLTYSKIQPDFVSWFKKYHEVVRKYFTPEAEDLFETFEDFALELYLTIKTGDY